MYNIYNKFELVMANWDDNDWESVSEENLRYFYEEYSASVRKQLLAKNLLVPQNVYDVLYPRTKEALMAKNVAKITDLEENSKTIRDALVAKIVSNGTDIEKISEDTRKSLLARNKIIQDANDLLNNSYSVRKNLLSKNTPDEGDLLKDSEHIRRANMSQNSENVSTAKNIDSNSDDFRINNLSKNKETTGDLETDSADFRINNISKNATDAHKELDVESSTFRENNISKNTSNNNADLEAIGDVQRANNLSHNSTESTGDIVENSNSFRNNNVSKNVSKESDIDVNSEAYRKQNLSNNIPSESNLELDSQTIRKNNESANVENNVDLETYSNNFRDKNISSNKESKSDIEKDSEEFRTKNISANKPDSGDLLTDSNAFLKNNISNNTQTNSDLEKDSENYRKNNTSSNKANAGDLLSDSNVFLDKNISSNKPSTGDLLTDSEAILKNNISSNKSNGSDLLNDSAAILKSNVSANKPGDGDLLSDSKTFLQNNVSANKPDNGDLLSDSQAFLQNNISANKPDGSDLLSDSETFLQNNISANKPDGSDLLIDSQPFLQNNISANKPDDSDLLIDSQPFLQDNVSANVPSGGDLLIDSQPFLNNNLAPNVPAGGDLLADSTTYLNSNLAPNVPGGGDLLTDSTTYLNNNTAPNVPVGGDLLTDSATYLNSNLAPNVPVGSDLLTDSNPFRNNLVSANVPTNTNLETFSKPFRDINLAANPPVEPLGTVIEGIGTSTFLGISRVMTQGLIIRQLLISKNKPSKFSIDNFMSVSSLDKMTAQDEKNLLISKNEFQLGKTEYTQLNANLILGDGPALQGGTVKENIQNQLDSASFYNRSIALNLQNKYGTNLSDGSAPANIGGGFYSLDTVGPKGGWFDEENAPTKVNFDIRYTKGSITDAIRNYNLSRNLYNLHRIVPGDLKSLDTLQQNADEGFQGLIAKTIGHFSGNDSIGAQLQGNLVPRGILTANEGAYIKGGSPENILRPQQAQGMQVGSPESMMAQTVAGNPLNDTEFQAGTKGIKHIMKTIKNSSAANFTINYDVQNSRKYIIGTNNDGTPKVARQRFTIANPYKPGNAKKLVFSLKNYSSGAEFYFPPYIQSYSDSYGANWNPVNFLGRPEAIYTYNNSTREGTISFVVLTDYSQNLVIGTDYTKDSFDDVKINPRVHFTTKDAAQNEARALAFQESEAKQKETNDTKKEYKDYNNIVSGGTPESNVLQQDIKSLEKQSNSIQQTQQDALTSFNRGNNYSETSNVITNINTFMTTTPSRDAGDIDTKAADSKKRIDEMIKNLAFQPAFFSGDKIDFQTKMDFLAKLTRPAKADEGSGFSFTRPPVCHIHLGDWWNNDIIIDSVSFNYDSAPWTLDGSRAQPMWATVTMNFKFVGPYRGQSGPPVLSDDSGGLYWDRGNNPNNNPSH